MNFSHLNCLYFHNYFKNYRNRKKARCHILFSYVGFQNKEERARQLEVKAGFRAHSFTAFKNN